MKENLNDKIIPHIEEDYLTGKKILIDSKGKKYICDLFGKKKIKFHKNITGISNYTERLKLNLIEKISNNFDKTTYKPHNIFLDGYFQFPNPKIKPFGNFIKNYSDIEEILKKKMRISNEKNKQLFDLNNNNNLSYMTSTIFYRDNTNKNIILNLIDNEMNNHISKEKRRGFGNYSRNEFIGIKNFRQKLKENHSDFIHGIKLNKPDQKFFEQYNLFHNLLFIKPNEKKKKKNRNKSKDNINYSEDINTISLFNKNKKSEDTFYSISNFQNQKKRIKSAKEIIDKFKLENNLLQGFKKEKKKEKGYYKKKLFKNFSMNDIYKKEIELRKKVNPQEFKKEEEKNIKEKQSLEKQKIHSKYLDEMRKKKPKKS